MIDLHCHILPAVDDGIQNITDSINMAKDAKKEGINKILLTPHHMDGEYLNHKASVESKTNNLQQILIDNNVNVELRAGQEVHINGDLIEAIESDDILYADGLTKKYMLLEFPHNGIPQYSEKMIFEIIVRGITPIIVHPERNLGFMKNPDLLYEFVKQGCLTQLTATSYLGGFGKKIEKFTEQIIDSGLGFTFSSDAHNFDGRRFRMDEAYSKLERKMGKEFSDEYAQNAENIWNGKDIDVGKIEKISEQGKFASILNKIVGKGK